MMTGAEEETDGAMEPWVQHHAVINMPRYAYNSASILQSGNVGFLITCTFRREKSATKEALSLLREVMKVTKPSNGGTPTTAVTTANGETQSNVVQAPDKRVKLSTAGLSTAEDKADEKLSMRDRKSSSQMAEVDAESRADGNERKREATNMELMLEKSGNGGEAKDGNVLELADEDNLKSELQEFMLVKLDTMGIIYISATKESPPSVLSIVSRIIKGVQASTRAPPQWCHRILPVQGTCCTKGEEVQALVFRLVKEFVDNISSPCEEPLCYAVAFNRRGAGGNMEEKAFDRGECIKRVTAAVNEVTSSVKVDLTAPKMVVVVELVPVAGARSSLMCAVSVLPGDLVTAKPKLSVKALAPQSKKRKHN